MSNKRNYPQLMGRLFGPALAIHAPTLGSILAVLGSRSGQEFVLPVEAAAPADPKPPTTASVPDNIAVVPVCGPLVRRATGWDAFCGMTSYPDIEASFMEALNDSSIEGILFDFDSPGGEVGGLFDLANLISAHRGTKPIWGAVNEMAFSAGYALASACERIIVTQTGGVGSIGVFTMHVDESQMDEKDGLKFTYVYFGEKKVDGNPHQPLADRARADMQSEVDRIGALFTETVARNRNLSAKTVRAMQAALFFGQEGIDARLADGVGTFGDAVQGLSEAIEAKRTATSAAQPSSGAAASAPNSSEQEKSEMAKLKTDAAAQTPAAGKNKDEADQPNCAETAEDPKDKEKEDEEEEEEMAQANAGNNKISAADPKEVVFLCKVAGRSDLVGSFIERGVSLEEVREELLTAKADEQKKPGAIDHHAPHTGVNSTDQLDTLAKSRAQQTGKPYSVAYREVLKENPRLYTQYLDQKDAALAK